MKFEWDNEKEAANIQKHGLNFPVAARVFLDPDLAVIYDRVHSSINEDRYFAIGLVSKVLTVVYTVKDDGTKRIISARTATKRERRFYYGSCKLHT